MQKILTADTWKLFVYLILPYVFMDNSVGFALTIIWIAGLTIWFFILGQRLNFRLVIKNNLNYLIFKIALTIVFFYLIFTLYLLTTGYNININGFDEKTEWKDIVRIPLHILTAFSFFFIIYFLSASITAIENKKNIKSILITFLLFCLLLFGIWWLQPRIKTIMLS